LGQPVMSHDPNIIVIGASARAAAFSALRAGMRAYAIDLFADCDLVDVCPAVKIKRYPQDFEQALADAPQAPWIYTGGLENYPDLIERMSALRPLYGNGADVLRRVRDPHLLAASLAGSDFAVPEILDSLPPQESKTVWLRKPRRSSGGLGIRKVKDMAHRAHEERYYFQELIRGASRSAVFLASHNGCEMLGLTEQQSGVSELPEEPFLYAGSISLADKLDARVMELGNVLTRRFGLKGLFNLDFIDDGDGIWPLEINPRYSASVEALEYALGENFLALHMAAFDPTFQGPRKWAIFRGQICVAKQIVYAARDSIVSWEIARLQQCWNVEGLLPVLADIPFTGTRILRGQPVVTVIAKSPIREQVQRLLKERVRAVKKRLAETE
jgi:predicted ATP-grasp superfamily ATP-dependent carboligase